MATVYQVPADILITALAEDLKSEFSNFIQPPPWAHYSKTGRHRSKAPEREDWWYVRAASLLRKVSIKGPIGIEHLRKLYGGRKNFGVSPDHFVKGSGSVQRKLLHQLERAGLVRILPGKGRTPTPQGQALLDKTAFKVKKQLKETIPDLDRY
ncbi:MAG: 30S ribosomal protein S19e [Candidatus Hodarchaeales archaeon]